MSKTLLDGWYSRAGSDDACRLHAYAVDGSAAALGLTPSHTLDTTLSRSDFLAILGGRLGVDVCGGGPCRFAWESMCVAVGLAASAVNLLIAKAAML